MRRSRRQNFASLPHALSNSSEKTHWNLSATMLRCSRSIWHSFGCFDSHIRNGSVGWMARKVQINQLVKSSYVCARHRLAALQVLGQGSTDLYQGGIPGWPQGVPARDLAVRGAILRK